jgi:sirohydrochlorin cobaltochelatase
MTNRNSLVLAAHGSLAAENSNQPLFDLAASIDRREKFAVVTPAFLNGQPEMANVLSLLPPGDVVIVPVMTSEGYYLNKIPGKFAENESTGLHQCFLSRVVGVHESIPDRISDRITQTVARHKLDPADTTVVVIGHGTRRNKTSGQSTLELTDELRTAHRSLKFETAFLDQDPTIVEIAEKISTTNTLIVPFLISRGPHSTEDVPQAFGLPSGPDVRFPIVQTSATGTCICDLPVGMYPEMADVCLELATEALATATPIEFVGLVGGLTI